MKNKFIIDTNLIIRILTNDDEIQSEQVKSLLTGLDNGEIIFYVPTMVVAECCWVMKSFYGIDKKTIQDALTRLLQSEGIEVEESIVFTALDLFSSKNVDFIDAYLATQSTKLTFPVLTWNEKDFRKLGCEFFSPNDI